MEKDRRKKVVKKRKNNNPSEVSLYIVRIGFFFFSNISPPATRTRTERTRTDTHTHKHTRIKKNYQTNMIIRKK